MMKKPKNRYMWAVLGTNDGLFGLFNSKWKAIDASTHIWNIRRPSIQRVLVNYKRRTSVLQVHDVFTKTIKHPEK